MKRICNLLFVVLMLSLVVVAGGCGTKFQLSSLEVSPEVCLPGETVVVSATLAYSGDVKGDYEAELLVNGAVEQTQTFTVEPGPSQSLSFTLTKGEPGRYVVQLEKLTASFMVLGASNLKVSLAEVEVGQPVTVTADLQNVTETEVTLHCCLLCQGKEVKAKDITVAGSSVEEVTFTLSQATSGMYKVELLGLSGSFKVLRPAEFKVANFDIAPNPVKVGGVTTITIDIENVGEVEGTYNASLVVDRLVEQTRDLILAAGAAKTEVFTVSKDSPGSYSIQIGGQEAILKVVKPVRLPTGTILVNELSSGLSQLIIRNQAALEVVVILSSPEEPKIPLLAFYVRSHASHTVAPIAEGTYILYFTRGEDWDNDAKKFLTVATYGRFMDEFAFHESSIEYTKWTVTFSEEFSETAPVWDVGEDEFPGLE